jgi:hypothetical protein
MDGEEFFDRLYSQFYVHFPCYALKSEDQRGYLAEPAPDGTVSLVILTDDDLIRRYRDMRQTVGTVDELADASALRKLLRKMPEAVTHVTFDPAQRFHRRYPVEVIRAGLARAGRD